MSTCTEQQNTVCFWVRLQCTAQHSTVQYSTAQHSTAQHSTACHLKPIDDAFNTDWCCGDISVECRVRAAQNQIWSFSLIYPATVGWFPVYYCACLSKCSAVSLLLRLLLCLFSCLSVWCSAVCSYVCDCVCVWVWVCVSNCMTHCNPLTPPPLPTALSQWAPYKNRLNLKYINLKCASYPPQHPPPFTFPVPLLLLSIPVYQ